MPSFKACLHPLLGSVLVILLVLGLLSLMPSEGPASKDQDATRPEYTALSWSPLRSLVFNATYERWASICNEENIVLARRDDTNADFPDLPRPWSITPRSFPTGDSCQDLGGLLLAVKEGSRRWLGSADQLEYPDRPVNESLAYETKPSYFSPRHCRVNYLNDVEACRILNQYSRVIMLGDSLMRHTAQGLLMLLTQDWLAGSFPRGTGKDPVLLEQCRCDGQFSEHSLCRQYNQQAFLEHDPRDYGVCSHLRGRVFTVRFATWPAETGVWDDLCTEDGRPILVVLNGGTHFQSDASETMKGFIDVVQKRMSSAKAACARALRFKTIWTGLNAQSRSLDEKYPHQSREKAMQFNALVDDYVKKRHGWVPIDFWNLTLDAMTSDGFHYLSDVNMYKATALLHVARHLEAT